MKHIITNLETCPTFNDPEIFSTPRNFDLRVNNIPRKYGHLATHRIFGWTENHAGRKEYQGPLVQGPYATLSRKDVAITAHKQEVPETLTVDYTDTLEIDGVEYEIQTAPNDNLSLKPLN